MTNNTDIKEMACNLKQDKSDRKALDKLVADIICQKNEALMKKKRERRILSKTLKENKTHNEQAIIKSAQSFKPVNRYKNLTGMKKEKDKKKANENKKELFKKYGVIIPTYEEIVKNDEWLTKCKEFLEKYEDEDVLGLKIKKVKDIFTSTANSSVQFHCKNMSLIDLNGKFEKNSKYILEVFDRTDKLKKRENLKMKRLKIFNYSNCTGAMYVFTYEQKKHLIALCRELLGDKYEEQYVFVIILPELCLRIFAQTHNMKEEDAIEYLKSVSLDH